MKPLGHWWTLRLSPIIVDTESARQNALRAAKVAGLKVTSTKINGKGYKIAVYGKAE